VTEATDASGAGKEQEQDESGGRRSDAPYRAGQTQSGARRSGRPTPLRGSLKSQV